MQDSKTVNKKQAKPAPQAHNSSFKSFKSSLIVHFWQDQLKFRGKPTQAFLESIFQLEEALKNAVLEGKFQIINDVEMGFALHAEAFKAENISAPSSHFDRFQKLLSKAFSTQSGRTTLPFCESLADFRRSAMQLGAVRPERSVPTSLCFIPYLAQSVLWPLLQNVRFQWNSMPLKIRPSLPRAGQPFHEQAILRSVGNLHSSFALSPAEVEKLSPLQKIQALQNRNQGGLVGLLHQLVPFPPKPVEWEFELSIETQSAELPVLKKTVQELPRQFNFPDGCEIWSATKLSATLAELGGALAGPEFLFSGATKWDQLPEGVVPKEGTDWGDAAVKVEASVVHIREFMTQGLPFLSPLLRYESRYNLQKELTMPFVKVGGRFKVIEHDLTSLVRWRTRSGSAVETLSTGLQSYLKQILSDTNVKIEEKKALETWTLEPEYLFQIDGREISEHDFLLAKVHSSTQLIELTDGTSIPKIDYDRVLALYLTRKRTFARMGEIGFHNLFKANLLAGTLNDRDASGSLEKFAALLSMHLDERMKTDEKNGVDEMARILSERRPLSPHAELWDYQSRGVAWILSRFRLGLNACLADEMGLGKTITTICAMVLLKPTRAAPALVLAPKSVVTNWQLELKKFAPHLEVAELEGEAFPTHAQVVVCGYHRFRNWSERNANKTMPEISLLVLDEAHILKNSATKISQTVRKLSASFKLALTGTPLENHLGELWNLLDILNPGFLGGVTSFRAYAEHARKNAENRELMLKPLREFLWVVMLRRTKKCAEVKLELPDKIYSSEHLNLTPEQAMAYRSVLEMALDKVLLSKSSFGQRAIFLKALLHLKQICIHPDVFFTGVEDEFVFGEKDAGDYVRANDEIREKCRHLADSEKKQRSPKQKFEYLLNRSQKFTRLFEILEDMKESEGGILIFTQFLGAARLLQTALSLSGEEQWANTEIFDGSLSTKQRDTMVQQFQTRCNEQKSSEKTSCPILILSLKAGGVGLNLTGATAVVHLDRWWNPAVEDQATDRAHRLGQTESVTVVTMTAVGTIEESMEHILEVKRALAKDILGQGSQASISDLMASPEGFAQLVDPARLFGAEGMMK